MSLMSWIHLERIKYHGHHSNPHVYPSGASVLTISPFRPHDVDQPTVPTDVCGISFWNVGDCSSVLYFFLNLCVQISLYMLRSQMACGVLAVATSTQIAKTVWWPCGRLWWSYGDRAFFCSPQGLAVWFKLTLNFIQKSQGRRPQPWRMFTLGSLYGRHTVAIWSPYGHHTATMWFVWFQEFHDCPAVPVTFVNNSAADRKTYDL